VHQQIWFFIFDEFPGVNQLLAGTQTDQKETLFVGETISDQVNYIP
jgi:hypothetical protein